MTDSNMSKISRDATPIVGATLKDVVEFLRKCRAIDAPEIDLFAAGSLVAQQMRELKTTPPKKVKCLVNGVMCWINLYDLADLTTLCDVVRKVIDHSIEQQTSVTSMTGSAKMVERMAHIPCFPSADNCAECAAHDDDCKCAYCTCAYCNPDDPYDDCEMWTDVDPSNGIDFAPEADEDARGCFRRDHLVAEKTRRLLLLKKQNGTTPTIMATGGRKRKMQRTSRRHRVFSGVV